MQKLSVIFVLFTGLAACAAGPGTTTPAATGGTPKTTATGGAAAAGAVAGAAAVDESLPADVRDRVLQAGYRKQVMAGKVEYCRSETPVGTRFAATTCLDTDQIVARFRVAEQQREGLRHAQDLTGNGK